jgi:hypothetical protein
MSSRVGVVEELPDTQAVKGVSTCLLSREQRVVARKEEDDEVGGMYE